VKEAYSAKVGGRGWLGPGAEANGYSEGTETPPDLKESLTFATHRPFEDPVINAEWYAPNVWPTEIPELQALCEEYLDRMGELEKQLLSLLGVALGLEADFFSQHMDHPTYGFNINWYPGVGGRRGAGAGAVPDRAAHRLRDRDHPRPAGREGGTAGLHRRGRVGGRAVRSRTAFTINIGDLMARWTGDRWRSGRHRVLPPPADAPAEELMSLVYFGECTPGTLVESVPAPVGRVAHEPSTRMSICGRSWTRSPLEYAKEPPFVVFTGGPGLGKSAVLGELRAAYRGHTPLALIDCEDELFARPPAGRADEAWSPVSQAVLTIAEQLAEPVAGAGRIAFPRLTAGLLAVAAGGWRDRDLPRIRQEAERILLLNDTGSWVAGATGRWVAGLTGRRVGRVSTRLVDALSGTGPAVAPSSTGPHAPA
jgi:hypothetical protein